MTNIGVILAGGIGSRMGLPIPKQFLELKDGRTVIEHSIDTFDAHPAIDEVAVVIHPEWKTEFMHIAEKCTHWKKVKQIIDGGSERYMSSLNAIMTYIDYHDDTNLFFHDAARPYITACVIDRVVAALENHEAVGVGMPSTDTVWEVRDDFSHLSNSTIPHFISRIPERKFLWLAQTPQAFRLPLIRDAYQRALQDPQFTATDDCGVVRRYMPEAKITVVEGDYGNIKISTPNDLGINSSSNEITR